MAGYSNQKVFILYEDEHLLVVKKPFGMESQRGKSFAMDQESLLRGYLSSKTKTDNPYLAVVHRLDRPVAGVMVYAKTKKAAADLSAQLQTENFSKKYEAVVSGIVPACEGRLEDYLTADKRTGTTSVSSKADPLAKKAVLTWKEIAREEVKSGEILLPYASSPSGMLPVKRTIKNNKFLYRQPCYGWRYFMLLLYIAHDISLVSLHAVSFEVVGCCSNLCN